MTNGQQWLLLYQLRAENFYICVSGFIGSSINHIALLLWPFIIVFGPERTVDIEAGLKNYLILGTEDCVKNAFRVWSETLVANEEFDFRLDSAKIHSQSSLINLLHASWVSPHPRLSHKHIVGWAVRCDVVCDSPASSDPAHHWA